MRKGSKQLLSFVICIVLLCSNSVMSSVYAFENDSMHMESLTYAGGMEKDTAYIDFTLGSNKSNTYMVTFDSTGGSAVASVAVSEGETLTKPTDPSRNGYIFGGWYKQFVPVSEWDFEMDTITKDITLYACWIKGSDADAPAPWGPTPTDAQLTYHNEELAAFVHFGVNTFTDREWGSGNETVDDFNPTNMTQEGVNQWVQELKDAGFKRLMMVGKHHDGFCMWDSKYTDFNVMNSPFGKDVMEMVSIACTKADMGMGFYISPWDMHEPSYGMGDAYNDYYNNQLIEVLGNPKYGNNGEFVEVWMDGAKGEGAAQEYDFDQWFDTIHEYEPNCLIYTDRADGGIRWSGNERGMAGDPCWQRMNVGTVNEPDGGEGMLIPWKTWPDRTHGAPNGILWSVCECDVSMRQGWFYHSNEAPKTMDKLSEIYFNSVGLGSVLLLNIPPDKTGNFSAEDSARLDEFGRAITETYKQDYVKESGVTAVAEQKRGITDKFDASKVIDDSDETYWTMDDGKTTGSITIDLGQMRTFDMVSIKEYIPLGQRISGFKVEYRENSSDVWKEFAEGTTIGFRRLVRHRAVTASQLKISITSSQAVPLISDVGVFKMASAFELTSNIPDGLIYVDDRNFEMTEGNFDTNWPGEDGINNTHTGTRDGTFTATFTGSKFYLMGIVDPGHGKFEVSVDGGSTTIVDSYSATRKIQQILYTSPDLTQNEHTITVRGLNQKNSLSKDTWLDFDGMYVLNNDEKGMFEIEQPQYIVGKNDTVDITVRRVGGAAGKASVKINTLPGTAVQGQYYEEVSSQLTFEDGEREKQVALRTFDSNVSNDMYFFFALSEPTNGAFIGFRPKVTVTISAIAVADSQQPKGETFTKDDSFIIPDKKGKPKRLEAEYSMLQPGINNVTDYVRVEDGPGDGNKHIGWFENGNSVIVPFTASRAGVYTLNVRYESGRSGDKLNTLNWRGDIIESGTKVVPSTLQPNGSTVYDTMEVKLTINESGYGELEFYADSQCSPNIDYIDFMLTSPNKYMVTFDSTGGSAVASVSVNKGENAVKPEESVKADSIFVGWYIDKTFKKDEYKFDTPLEEDITLYARWINKNEFVYGDVDKNGIVTANDAALVLMYVLNKENVNSDTEFLKKAMVNSEGTITASNATKILEKALNNDFEFDVKKIR